MEPSMGLGIMILNFRDKRKFFVLMNTQVGGGGTHHTRISSNLG